MEPSLDARPLSGALPEAARDLLQRERAALGDLRAVVARAELGGGGERAIATALEDLEGLFLLVVVGEFNAGKSTLINAMLGAQVMREGVTPTTDRVTLIVHGERETTTALSAELVRLTHPAPRLRALALVDTPGTNAVITHHQVLTERFVPRSDLVLFVTSADRPFTESERSFLQRIAEWGRKVTVVVNKADLLEDEAERDEVLAFVRNHARDTLGHTPTWWPWPPVPRRGCGSPTPGASTREAEAALAATGLPALERLLAERVDVDRVRLKLEAGLGVAHHVAQETATAIDPARAAARRPPHPRRRRPAAGPVGEGRGPRGPLLPRPHQDGAARGRAARRGLPRRHRPAEQPADPAAPREGPHGVRGAGAARRRGGDRRRGRGDERLVRGADAPAVGGRRRLRRRAPQGGRRAGRGRGGGRFRYDRSALIGALRERAEGVLEGYDVPRRVAAPGRGAAGQRPADRAARGRRPRSRRRGRGAGDDDRLGHHRHRRRPHRDGPRLMVLPRRKAKAKRQLHQQMQALRDGLEGGFGRQLDEEVQRATERLTGAVAPYTRFVRAELERLDALATDVAAARTRVAGLRSEAAQLGPTPR
jgi:small GTP-binding protein